MAQLQAPQIRTSIGDPGQYMQAAAANLAGVRQATGDIMDRYNYEDKMKLAAQERNDRLAQQAIDNKRAEAMLTMQQNQEQRAVDALTKVDATQKATMQYANTLGNYGKDVVTEDQAKDLLAKYNAGKNVQGEYDKKVAAYNADPSAKRDMLNQLAVPTDMDGKVIDPTMLLALKNNALEGQQKQADTLNQQKFDRGLLKEKFKNDKAVTGMKISADVALEGLRNKNDLTKLDKAFQQQPEQVKQAVYAADFAKKDYDKLDNKTKAKYGSVDNYLLANNPAYQTKAINQIAYGKALLDTKDPELSTYTDANMYGNANNNAEKIGALQNAGYSKAQIKAAFAAASKGANELSLFGLNSPDVNLDQVDKYLLNTK